MNNAVTLIETTLTGDPAIVRIQQALEQDEVKAKRYIANILNVVANGSDQLKNCTPESILNCAVESIVLELPIDSRQLCSLVPRGGKATLAPQWQGYVYKIKKYNPTADIQVGLVYDGDQFSVTSQNGIAKYKHRRKDAFASDPALLVGAYCYISYAIDGERFAVCEVMGKAAIEDVKSEAKTKNVWQKWYGEMAKKSVIRRAAKLHFAGAVHEIDAKDNQHFDIGQEETVSKADIWNEPQKEPGEDAKDITPDATTEPPPPQERARRSCRA